MDIKITEGQLTSPKEKKLAMAVAIALLFGFSFFLLGTFSREAVVVSSSNFLDFLRHLQIYYWIGLALVLAALVVLWSLEVYRAEALALPAVTLLGVMLLSVPVFLQENAPFFVSYYPAGEVQTVLQDGHFDLLRDGPLLNYHYWPGLHIFSAANILITGVQLSFLLKYMPLLWVVVFVLLTRVVARSFGLELRQWIVLAWLALVAQWIGQYYYSAQGLAVLLYLVVIFSLFASRVAWEQVVIFIAAMSALIVTHSLTAFTAVLSIFMMSLYRERTRTIAALAAVLFISFYLFMSVKMFDLGVREYVGRLISLDLNMFWTSSEFSAPNTNQMTKMLHYNKLMFAAAYMVMFLAALGGFYKNRARWPEKKTVLFQHTLLWMAGIGFLLIYKYGTEIHYRIYLFATLFIVCLLVTSFPRSKIVLITAIVLTVLFIPARYGTFSYEQTLATELAGTRFVATRVADPRISYVYQFPCYIWYYDPGKLAVPYLLYAPQLGEENYKTEPGSASYIADSLQSHNYMSYAYGFDRIAGWVNENKDKIDTIYDNGSFWTYKT